jgi:hypothetical protein
MARMTDEDVGENVLPDGDYVANDGLWLTCQKASIRIVPDAQGISISVYREGEEMENAVSEQWVPFSCLAKPRKRG